MCTRNLLRILFLSVFVLNSCIKESFDSAIENSESEIIEEDPIGFLNPTSYLYRYKR